MTYYRKWTDKDLEDAVKSSDTKSDVLRKLGLSPKNSGNFQTVNTHIKVLNLDTSHFKSFSYGGRTTMNHSLEDVLVENSTYSNSKNLKIKLIKNSKLENKCYECGISEWIGKKLNLHLDHKNGKHDDNRLENLRLLCPNCHSLTETYCRGERRKKIYNCSCGQIISPKAKQCSVCSGMAHRNTKLKIDWPDIEKLKNMVSDFGYSGTGKRLGVTGNTVKKYIQRRD